MYLIKLILAQYVAELALDKTTKNKSLQYPVQASLVQARVISVEIKWGS